MHDFSHQKKHALMVGALIFKDGHQTAGYVMMTLNVGLAFTFTAQGSSTGYSTKHTVVATVDGSEIQRSPAQLAVEIPLPVQSTFFYIPGGLRFLDHQQYHWKLKHDAVFFLLGQYFLNIHMSKGQNGLLKMCIPTYTSRTMPVHRVHQMGASGSKFIRGWEANGLHLVAVVYCITQMVLIKARGH